ncbi:MAG TPA: di-heme oxidoredictase family protein, partial [Kofleriaceae bacterium]|nr:di-heme oxidoredictase family protein [Kofleriaceae bacterium]
MGGRGLLEAVPAAALEALEDPHDADGDGLAGRLNTPWDVARHQAAAGRFGHKGNTPGLRQQVAAAYANDMGVSSPMFPDADGRSELDDATVDAVTLYSATLGVPARGPSSPAAERGEALFAQLGCAGCHVPQLQTGEHPVAALAHQEIWPYSDLLLHDLGDELADGRPDFAASGRHWRTAPLWGVGLAQTVTPGAGFLHDGRARTLAEAILWHGGEAERAREAFRLAPRVDREALLAFLGRL